jgi:ribosomal protein L40E
LKIDDDFDNGYRTQANGFRALNTAKEIKKVKRFEITSDLKRVYRFEITYKLNESDKETLSIETVVDNEKKALKAFSLKVPGIPSNQIIAVNGQPVKEEWFSDYPKSIPKRSSNLMTCPHCSAKISKRAEHCPKCNETILAECMVCGCKIRKDSSNECPKCGDPYPFTGPENSALEKNSRTLLKDCPSCGRRISERAPRCPGCNTPTTVPCKICGKKISCWNQTCPECGDPEPFNEKSKPEPICEENISCGSPIHPECDDPEPSPAKIHAKQKPGPSGIGGWLLLLVVGMMVLGPLLGASQINMDFLMAEHQYPGIKSVEEWQVFKTITWWAFLSVAAISFYGGWGLARGNDWSVVSRAKTVLWITGPGASLVLGVLLPMLFFRETSAVDAQFIGAFLVSGIAAAIWTTYLAKSKRVRNTYGPHDT